VRSATTGAAASSHLPVRQEWLDRRREDAIEPDLATGGDWNESDARTDAASSWGSERERLDAEHYRGRARSSSPTQLTDIVTAA